MTTSAAEVQAVLQLKAEGLTDRAVSQLTGVPVATIRGWRRRGTPGERFAQLPHCPECRCEPHRWDELPPATYAYLLGVYLGDGHVRSWGTGRTLRVALDTAYPGIIDECVAAIAAIRGTPPVVKPDYGERQCVRIESYWRSWPCLLPQHGPGRKHSRPIVLADWQQRIVDAAPGAFLRGLIHTDGWRGLNKVRVKGHDYAYPRYQFSNRSDDIRKLFTDTCEKLDIEWRQWTRFHVSVAKRDSVAALDRFVGPKR